MMEQFLESFHQIMSNRTVGIVVMLTATAGAIAAIAGGFYCTYLLVTFIGN